MAFPASACAWARSPKTDGPAVKMARNSIPAHDRLLTPAWALGPTTDGQAAEAACVPRPHGPKAGPAGHQQIAAVHL
jgi:hypothetical protein